MSEYAKVYISMPRQFLQELDRTAGEEHLSRSALIREAVKLYMSLRSKGRPRFFELTEQLRGGLADRSEAEIEERIDRAVKRVRTRSGHV